MPGLGPNPEGRAEGADIHDFRAGAAAQPGSSSMMGLRAAPAKAWMAGPSPAMTGVIHRVRSNAEGFGGRIDRVTHYVAIVEEEDGKAVGVWFPDLPGCFSAGNTLDEAMLNAREAIALYADALRQDGRPMPRPHAHRAQGRCRCRGGYRNLPYRPDPVRARGAPPGCRIGLTRHARAWPGIHDVRAERRGAGAAGVSRIWTA